MHIVTVRWCDPENPKYGPEFVEALRNQLSVFGHDLTCLGDDRPLRDENLTGWWAKLEAFAPWNEDIRPCLHIDLDTFVVGDVRPIMALDTSKLWLIKQFLSNTHLGESGLFIAPDTELSDRIWERRHLRNNYYGDGAYLRSFPHAFIPDAVDGIYSYKRHCQQTCPRDARVVCFHGKPKPPNLEGWALSWWQTSLNYPTKNCS